MTCVHPFAPEAPRAGRSPVPALRGAAPCATAIGAPISPRSADLQAGSIPDQTTIIAASANQRRPIHQTASPVEAATAAAMSGEPDHQMGLPRDEDDQRRDAPGWSGSPKGSPCVNKWLSIVRKHGKLALDPFVAAQRQSRSWLQLGASSAPTTCRCALVRCRTRRRFHQSCPSIASDAGIGMRSQSPVECGQDTEARRLRLCQKMPRVKGAAPARPLGPDPMHPLAVDESDPWRKATLFAINASYRDAISASSSLAKSPRRLMPKRMRSVSPFVRVRRLHHMQGSSTCIVPTQVSWSGC